MKVLQVLKLLWRSILAQHEAKFTFYRRNKTLIDNKKWDYLFRAANKQGVELLFFDSEKELLYLKKDGITIVTNDDYGLFVEVLIDNVYMLPPQLTGSFVVFDVGMNRGFASLFFANHPDCKKVFGYELSNTVFERAVQNFALNKTLAEKILPYNFGLWNENGEIDICKCEIDGYTGIASCIYEQEHLRTKLQTTKLKKISKAKVRKASEVFEPLLAEINPSEMKVLKIDIEGAEYAVFEDLYQHNLLQEFDVIIGEAHNGMEGLNKYLEDFVCMNKNHLSNLLITFCYVNKRIIHENL